MTGWKTMTWSVAGLMLATSVLAATSDSGANPYAIIAKRNVFGLQDPPAPAPPPEPDKPPPSEVKLTGITTLLGIRRALFKVQTPAKPPQPAQNDSYILVEGGPAEGGLQVVKIDVENEKVRIRRNGKEEWLALEKDTSKPAAAPAVASVGKPNNPIAAALARARQARAGNQPGAPRPGSPTMPLRNMRTGQPGAPTATATGISLGTSHRTRVFQAREQVGDLTPEEQVIMIEANRLKTLEDQASGFAPPPPATALTPPELDPSTSTSTDPNLLVPQ